MSQQTSTTFALNPADNSRLATLCGELNSNIKQIEGHLDVKIVSKGNLFSINGNQNKADKAKDVLKTLYSKISDQNTITSEQVHMTLTDVGSSIEEDKKENTRLVIATPRAKIQGQNPSQRHYLRQILTKDINFGIGPAGTGKTFLAVACAAQALNQDEIKRIVLVRPAVEAGERLGFLPGDIGQKVDPYLRPLYDALYEMFGFEKVARLMERNIIELAPLAYMRGRTLNDSFVILDEGQNTTIEQMKMLLTRVGFGSKAVITGDITQIDLPKNVESGLKHASRVLKDIDGISFTYFKPEDVVRHPLVQRIVTAYESHNDSN